MMRSAGLYFLARALTAAFGLLAVAVFTRLGTPEIYGAYTLVLTAAVTTFAVCFHWIQSAVLRFLPGEGRPAGEPGRRSPVLGAALAGYALAAALVVAALALVAIAAPRSIDRELWLLAGGLTLAYAAMEITLAILHARQRPGSYALLLLGRAAASLAVGSLLLLLGHGAEGLLLGVLVAHAAPVLAVAWRWRRHLALPSIDRGALHRMAAFGLPLGVVGIAGSVIGISDRYMLGWLVGLDAAGSYAAPYDLAQRSLQILMLSAFLATSPTIFRRFEEGGRRALDQSLLGQARLMLATALPAATLLAAGAPLVARLLFGEAFRDAAVGLIPIIVAATLAQGLQSYYFSYCFTLAERTLANAAVVGVGALVNILLNLLLIPAMGANGAAIATLASFLVVLGVSIAVTRRWMTLPWPGGDTARTALVCLAAAPLIAAAARLDDLGPALLGTALAALLLPLLLVATDVAGCRAMLGRRLAVLLARRRASRAARA